jgi:chemotaxis signal transduction protein
MDIDPAETFGTAFDRIRKVATLPASAIQHSARLGPGWRPELTRYVAQWSDDFVVVPDLRAILA